MIDDSQISALLIQKKLRSNVTYYRGLTIPLDNSQVCWHENDENPKNATTSEAPAYVIYTSGSTGIPKGVMGTHRGAVNRFAWMWRSFPFETNEKSCVKTSLSFVDSVWEVFGPMLKGVRIALIPDDVLQDIPRFVQELAQRRITRIVLVPSLLQSILDTVPDILDRLPDLKIWSSSGESLSKELADQFRMRLPGRKLLNLYGSSEVAADVTFYDCCDREQGSNMRIGRPINNTQTYILDSGMQPVPIGLPGEIYVGGAGLARGYVNRPKLTHETFIRTPFTDDANSRLYRTGDLARYGPDGNIEFLGRFDDQVKVRGYRIELGEIESAVMKHHAISHCVVTVHKNKPSGSDQIVGYIVPLKGSDCPIAEVRRFVAGKLPEYMVPSQFIALECLPLMPNGKVNRHALPLPNEITPQLTAGLVETRTEMEELVAQIWRETLTLERIGIDDNFFELGGHSLLAAQIVFKLRLALAKPVSLRILFESPTIAGLAYELERTLRVDDGADLPPIVPVSHKGPLPVSISQEPFFVVDQLIGGASFFNMPYAYRLSGPLKVAALERTIQEVVSRHASLRSVFAEVHDRPRQTIRPMRKIRLPLIDLTKLPSERKEQKLKRLSNRDARQRFKLWTGPVFRVKLIRLDEQEHIVLVTMHHIITDQWSMSIFRRELGTLYAAFSLGQTSPLPPPSLQFVDFVVWQKRLLKQGHLKWQVSYWKKQLAEPLSTLDFQRGSRRRRKRIRFRSARQPVEIDVAVFEAIKAFARRENCTTFMVFATALMILLHLLTDERDIRVSTLVANRGQPGTEGMIGYFANMLILRNYVSPDMSGRQLLKEVRDVCLSAYARQDLPFDYLEALLEKEGNVKPLCQVMLNYRNFPIAPRKICGLTIASWDAQSRIRDPGLMISRLDMMIHLRDTATKLTGAVNYKTDLFTDERITKMMTSFRTILSHLSVQPDHQVVDYSVHINK
jgi:amino acid adenylation domain-containing protein